MDDALVVEVSEASESIPYDGLFGDGRKSCDVDMEQPLLEIGEDQDVSLGNAIHGCSDMGRVLDVPLERNQVVEVAWDDVFENELLPIVSEWEGKVVSIFRSLTMHRTDHKERVNRRRAVHAPSPSKGRPLGEHSVNDIELAPR